MKVEIKEGVAYEHPHADPAWWAEVSKIDGYAGMNDRECTAWARKQSGIMAGVIESSTILKAMELGHEYIAIERCDRIAVLMPRVYRSGNGWSFDRSKPFKIEGRAARWVHHLIVEATTDSPPRSDLVVVRGIARA